VIDGVPPGKVNISVRPPKGSRNDVITRKWIVVKSNENVEVDLSLDLKDPENGGDDD